MEILKSFQLFLLTVKVHFCERVYRLVAQRTREKDDVGRFNAARARGEGGRRGLRLNSRIRGIDGVGGRPKIAPTSLADVTWRSMLRRGRVSGDVSATLTRELVRQVAGAARPHPPLLRWRPSAPLRNLLLNLI